MGGNGIRKFTDGIINVQDGKGIAHSIKTELGLTQTQFNKCIGGIFDIVREQQNAYKTANESGTGDGYNLFLKGDKLDGSSRDNFVVHKGHVLKFTQALWQKLIDFVNRTLGLEGDDALQYGENDTDPNTAPPVPGNETELSPEQTSLKTQTETLMGKALGENKTITKGEQYGGSVITGYIYSYQEIPEGGKKQTVEVTTDADGKPTTVVLKDENDITTVTYDLTGKTMTIGIGSTATEITLDDTQLAIIKEKAFLMANNEQLSNVKKAVTDITSEEGSSQYSMTMGGDNHLLLTLTDNRRILVKLDDSNNITSISFVNTLQQAGGDGYSDIVLSDNGRIAVDRDTQWNTTQNNQSITQADAKLFNELKEQLQALVTERKDEIANLRDDAFSEKYKTQLTEGNAVVTAFQQEDANNITLSDEHNNTDRKYYYLKLSDGKGIRVELGDDGKTIENIQIRMKDENNSGPDNIPDIVYYSNGKVLVDPDYNDSTKDGNDADQTHTYVSAEASGYDNLKQDVITLLAKMGITDVE